MKILSIVVLGVVIGFSCVSAGQRPQVGAPMVVDSTGTVLGAVIGSPIVEQPDPVIVLNMQGVPTYLLVRPTKLSGRASNNILEWQSPDCTGTPLIMPITPIFSLAQHQGQLADYLLIGPNTVYVPIAETPLFLVIGSHREITEDAEGPCITGPLNEFVYEAMPLPRSILNVFVPPFSITGVRAVP
ncbi:MAG TPA: hypothetical protein VGC99_28775 [Candidatus Tectomicrobia bacterium]